MYSETLIIISVAINIGMSSLLTVRQSAHYHVVLTANIDYHYCLRMEPMYGYHLVDIDYHIVDIGYH